VRFAHSAFRHGITEAQIRHIVDEYGPADSVELVSNPDAVGLLYVGDDRRGVPLEVIGVAIDLEGGEHDLLIIHAMPLRLRYRRDYQRIMQERWS
jgi:hypothetical protein